MEKGMAGDRGSVAAAGDATTGAATVEPMIKAGLINGFDGTTASLDDHPDWPMHGPAGELFGNDGSRLIKGEDGNVSYVDADGKERKFHEWLRATDPSTGKLGERIHDIWSESEGDGLFGGSHPNDVAQQLVGGGTPDFGPPRTMQELSAERATH